MNNLAAIVTCGTLEELRQALGNEEECIATMRLHHNGVSLLHIACSADRWDMAEALVREHGHLVDLPCPGNGGTALHQMCDTGRVEAVLFLTRSLGANPGAIDHEGFTALHAAAWGGHTELARILVRTLGLQPNVLNYLGETPLFTASLSEGAHEHCVIAHQRSGRARRRVRGKQGHASYASGGSWAHRHRAGAHQLGRRLH